MNQNYIQEEIKNRMKSGNACYHLVQNLLSSSQLSKNVKIQIYRIIILSVVLYRRGTWSFTLRKEFRLSELQNRVLRIFGTKKDEVTGEWRKLHDEQLNYLYSSPNIIQVIKQKRMRWAGHITHMTERRGAYKVLVGKPGRKRPFEEPGIEGRIILSCVFRKWDGGH
jgi:hypothetical protein